jgi:hypothetical protein
MENRQEEEEGAVCQGILERSRRAEGVDPSRRTAVADKQHCPEYGAEQRKISEGRIKDRNDTHVSTLLPAGVSFSKSHLLDKSRHAIAGAGAFRHNQSPDN